MEIFTEELEVFVDVWMHNKYIIQVDYHMLSYLGGKDFIQQLGAKN